MFLRQMEIEFRKTLKHPWLWLGLGLLTLFLTGAIFIFHLQIKQGHQSDINGLADDLIYGLSFYLWVSGMVYGVTAAVISADDYPEHGLQLWLTRGQPRPLLLLARLTVILLLVHPCFSVKKSLWPSKSCSLTTIKLYARACALICKRWPTCK